MAYPEDRLPDPATGKVLLALNRLSAAMSADEWVTREAIATELQLADYQTHEHLVALKDAGLARDSGWLAGGWRPTSTGCQLAEHLQASRASGREWHEHTMRELLRRAITDEDGDFTRDEWGAWDLHEPGLAPVPVREREAAVAALEQQGYIRSIRASGARHIRCEVTSKGQIVLGRPDVSLADAVFGQPASTTTYDQRVGIQTHTFANQGAIQTGDHAVQHVTITNDQRRLVIQHLGRIRKVLSDQTLPADVVETVQATVDAIEAAVNDDDPQP